MLGWKVPGTTTDSQCQNTLPGILRPQKVRSTLHSSLLCPRTDYEHNLNSLKATATMILNLFITPQGQHILSCFWSTVPGRHAEPASSTPTGQSIGTSACGGRCSAHAAVPNAITHCEQQQPPAAGPTASSLAPPNLPTAFWCLLWAPLRVVSGR